jgi:hypothetical protein
VKQRPQVSPDATKASGRDLSYKTARRAAARCKKRERGGELKARKDEMFQEGQRVRANLAGIEAKGVLFHAAVTDAVGNIVRQTSENPPKYLVRLMFSFKGVNEVEVPAERIKAI